MKYGDTGFENVELKQLAKSSKNGRSRAGKTFQMIKSAMKIILSVLLGDPTMLISNVIVEIVSHG